MEDRKNKNNPKIQNTARIGHGKRLRDLLYRFGNLSGALCAADARLLDVTGVGQEAITEFRLIEAAALNFGQSRIMQKPALVNWNQMINYCRTKIAEKNREKFHVLFLDNKNRPIAD